jgi:hypothetical protein
MEIDPWYCDIIVSRWEQFTGKQAVLAGTDVKAEPLELKPSESS